MSEIPDQGTEGSSVGWATWIGLHQHEPDNEEANEHAQRLYEQAQQEDPWPEWADIEREAREYVAYAEHAEDERNARFEDMSWRMP